MTYPLPSVSATALDMWDALPGRYREQDGVYNWPLLHFCESVCRYIQSVNDVARDQPDGTPGWAVVMDPDTAPAAYLPWLGQMVGVTVSPNQTEDQQRNSIKTEQGFARGTVAYMRSAIQAYLRGTKTVNIAERDTSPYHFTVTVYNGEIAGGSYSELESQYQTYTAEDAAFATYDDMMATTIDVENALVSTKPAGLVAALVFTPGTP